MVTVAHDHAVEPVDACAEPSCFVVAGDGGSHGDVAVFQLPWVSVGLVDQVDAVFVAQFVPA